MSSASDSRRSSGLLALSHVSQQSQDSHQATLPDRYEVCQPFAPRAYRISDVCKITRLGRTTIYAAIKSGDLIARKYGRATIVLADDLEAFLRSLQTTSRRSQKKSYTSGRRARMQTTKRISGDAA
jgi:hypothetical protein